MVTQHKNALGINNYSSQVVHRRVNPDLLRMHWVTWISHALQSLLFGPRLRHPEELWFVGKIWGSYIKRERRENSLEAQNSPTQLGWALYFQFLPGPPDSTKLVGLWTTLAEDILTEHQVCGKSYCQFIGTTEWLYHQHHEQIFIRCMCLAMTHGGYGCAFLLFRKTWAPVLTPPIYWSWASYPTFWASVFSSTRASIKAYLPEL